MLSYSITHQSFSDMAPQPRESETSKALLQKPTDEHGPFMFDKGQVEIRGSPSTGGTVDVRSLATKKSVHIYFCRNLHVIFSIMTITEELLSPYIS